MSFEFQSICDQGAVRPKNEDAIRFGIANKGQLAWMIIADGMGGHQAGEIASNILVSEIENAIQNLTTFDDIDWLCWIEIELNRANNQIYLSSRQNPERKGMGTTAVLVIVVEQECFIGWVGDSRCYLYRKNTNLGKPLAQLTIDHTMIQALLDKGAITPKEAELSNNKNMLSKALGVKRGIDVETKQLSIQTQDLLILSTDGLHDSLSENEMAKYAEQITNCIDVGSTFVQTAISNGSRDNITFGSILINTL